MVNHRRRRIHRYEIIISSSNQDEAFVADVPELPGCKAHGNTPLDALSNGREAINLWVDTAREFGDTVPQPEGRRLLSVSPSLRLRK